MSPPKTLFVGRARYTLPLPEGQARKWDALERELDYRVLATAADGDAARSGRFELVRSLPVADGLLYYLLLPWRIRRSVRAFRPEAVVAEDPHTAAAALVARRFAGRPRPRVVAEVHGNWRFATRLHGSPARRLLGPLVDAIDAAALRRVDGVRALSAYTASLAEEVRGEPVQGRVPTFSDLGAFEGPHRPLPHRPTALFVGVLERYKNVDGLAAAWREVTRRLPSARLVVVGKGSRRAFVESFARELPEHVEYIPELQEPADVARAMDDSWLLVLPSRFEGLGRVVIEAFARGRGVVGGRAGGILDLVREEREGLLVDPEDVEGLANALVRVLSDRALAERLGASAAERYGDWRSTPEEYAARLRTVIESALAPPG